MPSPLNRRRWRLGVPAIVMTVLALLLGMFASPALAASTISGVVTDADGTPLAGVPVSLGTVSGSTFSVTSSTTTGANGSYSFAGTNGTFAVRYQSPVDAVAYWKSAGVATTDIAQAGTVTSSASADATASAPLFSRTIKGTVTTSNGIPIPNVTVTVEKRIGTGAPFAYNAAATAPSSVVTDADGVYSLSVAQASNLVLGFTSSAYNTAYYKTSSTTTATKDDAAVVPFAATGTPVTFNPKLSLKQGSVTGTVTRGDAVTAPKISGATVELLKSDGTSFSPALTDTTGSDGVYSITADPGSYKVKFSASGFDTEFYNNVATVGSAQTVTISGTTATTGIDAGLARTAGPQISGTVTNGSGVPVSGVAVKLYTRTLSGSTGETTYTPVTTTPSSVVTASDGTYSFDVAPGSYVVEFSAAAYKTVYFNGSTNGTTDRSAATAVSVTKGTGRDISMALTANGGVVFTGKVVTGSSNAAVSGVQVRVEYPTSTSNGATTYTVAATGTTASDGTYSVTAPTASGRQYVVGFVSSAFPTKYYTDPATAGGVTDGTTSRDNAKQLQGTSQVVVPLSDLRLNPGSAVTGTVSDPNGLPLSGVDVTAVIYDTTTQTWKPATAYFSGSPTARTGNDGAFYLALTATGVDKPFRLQYSTANREVRYFPAAISPDEGTNITVANNQVIGARDAVLPSLAKLNGSITTSDGGVFGDGGTVVALRKTTYTEAGENGGARHTEYREIGRASVNSSGGFSLAVPHSTFRLQYLNTGSGEQGFLPGFVGLDQAPDITLTEGQTLNGQSYTAPTRQFIRGTVRDNLGTARSGATVEARYRYVVDIVDDAPVFSAWLGPVALTSVKSATTTDQGQYALPVYGRTYRVSASTTSGGVTTTAFYANGTGQIANATDVVVNGNDVTGIDISVGTGTARNFQLPWVSGLNKDGAVLTANTGSWSPSDLTFTYLWQQNANPSNASGWANASGTNNAKTYTIPTPGGIFGGGTRYAYRVVVTASRSGATAGTATSQPTGVQVASSATPDVENRRVPYITGTPAVGETLTSTGGDWSASGTFTYQWFANGQAIAGANGLSLVLTPDTQGKTIKFRVIETSGKTPANGEVVDSADTTTILPGVLRNTVRPTISGDLRVAAVLTADPGTWSLASPNFSYQWYANGDAIDGATQRTYTLTAAEKGDRISVVVTARAQGYTNGTASSVSTAAVGDNTPKNTVAPSISGTPAVASLLTADPGTWTPSGLAYAYQWFADGVAISGATAQTYRLTDAEFGKSITVKVTASTQGYVPASVTSAAVGPVVAGQAITVSGGPKVSGSAAPGGVLTVTVGTYTPSDATVSVQWLRNGVAIPGATGTVYTVTSADVDQLVSAQVTYARTGYVTTVRTSPAVQVASTPVKSTPTIAITKVVSGGKVKLVVTVTGGDTLAGGRVSVSEGSRTYAVKTLRSGRASFTVKGLKAGYHALRVKYLGSSTVKPGSKVVSVTIRS